MRERERDPEIPALENHYRRLASRKLIKRCIIEARKGVERYSRGNNNNTTACGKRRGENVTDSREEPQGNEEKEMKRGADGRQIDNGGRIRRKMTKGGEGGCAP